MPSCCILGSSVRWWDNPYKTDSHGEFGLAASEDGEKRKSWREVRSRVKNWLEAETQETLTKKTQVIDAIVGNNGQLDKQSLLRYLTHQLYDEIYDASDNPEVTGEGLAERLAEAGILPMYGMPSIQRSLFHYLDYKKGPSIIDRPLELAITEFAPGSQKTKDGAILKAIGFTSPLIQRTWNGRWTPSSSDPLAYQHWMLRCLNCGKVVMQKGYECDYCGTQNGDPKLKSYEIATPSGFRTDLSKGKSAKEEDAYFGMPTAFAESSEEGHSFNPVNGLNSGIKCSERNRVWRINDNNGKLFKCWKITTEGFRKKDGKLSEGPGLSDQWISEDFIHDVTDETPEETSENSRTIALAAGKTTDVLRFKPHNVREGINLDPSLSKGGLKRPFILLRSSFGL